LNGRPPMTDVFGKAGRRWLAALELPADERETVDCCLRDVDFLDSEVGLIERELARQAMSSCEIRRLMSVPGVSLVSAAAFVAAAGEIHRFSTPKKLVSYVGLDPRVRQSGEGPARHGHISKQGSSEARHMLCEAAWVAVRTPGPLHAFYERVRARRGAQIALVATARKLSVLSWQLLTREQDYALRAPVAHASQAARARAEDRGGLATRALFRPTRSRDQGGARARARVLRPGRDRLPQARPGPAAQTTKERGE